MLLVFIMVNLSIFIHKVYLYFIIIIILFVILNDFI